MAEKDNILFVDLGNSSLKWSFAEHGNLLQVSRLSHRQESLQEKLDSHWGGIRAPEGVWVAAVAGQGLQDELEHWVQTRWSVPLKFMRTGKSACGVSCAYDRPADLGVDRWAAIVGARQLYPQGVCVMDCGTAITLDVVHGDGRHLGGYILPGFELMRQCLFNNTAISVVDMPPAVGEWGTSTASCIGLGGRKAVAALLESSVERLQAAGVCDPALLLTGSAVDEIAGLIEIDYEIHEHLVLEGLMMYARGQEL